MNHTIRATDGTIIEVEDYSRGKAIMVMAALVLWNTYLREGTP